MKESKRMWAVYYEKDGHSTEVEGTRSKTEREAQLKAGDRPSTLMFHGMTFTPEEAWERVWSKVFVCREVEIKEVGDVK